MTIPNPNTEPAEINAGDMVQWKKTLSDFPASAWTLSYVLVKPGTQITFDSVPDGDDHQIILDSFLTADYTAGTYQYQAYVTDIPGLKRHTVGRGTIKIKTDLTAQTDGYDFNLAQEREHVEQVIEALQATIAKKATRDQLSTLVGGEKIEKLRPGQVLMWLTRYKEWLASIEQREALAAGEGFDDNIHIRFI